MAPATRPVLIEHRAGAALPRTNVPDSLRPPAPPSLGLSLTDAQSRVHFQLRTIDDPAAQLLSCAFYPSGNAGRSDALPKGTVHLDYLVDGQRVSLNQRQDDDVDGPLRYVVKPGATRSRHEVVDGAECVVLRSHNGLRLSSVNWKEASGVVFRLEARDLVTGLDDQLVLRILRRLR